MNIKFDKLLSEIDNVLQKGEFAVIRLHTSEESKPLLTSSLLKPFIQRIFNLFNHF